MRHFDDNQRRSTPSTGIVQLDIEFCRPAHPRTTELTGRPLLRVAQVAARETNGKNPP